MESETSQKRATFILLPFFNEQGGKRATGRGDKNERTQFVALGVDLRNVRKRTSQLGLRTKPGRRDKT